MDRLWNDSAHWRTKADEARAVADHLRDPNARAHMRSAARSYDRLAELAEKHPLADVIKRIKPANDEVA